MSLREEAVEAMARGLSTVTGLEWEVHFVDAEEALDALLDHLNSQADEWSSRYWDGLNPREYQIIRTTETICGLLAVLRRQE